MPAASNAQVQQYVDERVRPRCEEIRALYQRCKDDKATIDDVYANLTSAPTWDDSRDDNPPHFLTPADVLAWNTFINGIISLVEGTFADVGAANAPSAQYQKVLQGCVRAIRG